MSRWGSSFGEYVRNGNLSKRRFIDDGVANHCFWDPSSLLGLSSGGDTSALGVLPVCDIDLTSSSNLLERTDDFFCRRTEYANQALTVTLQIGTVTETPPRALSHEPLHVAAIAYPSGLDQLRGVEYFPKHVIVSAHSFTGAEHTSGILMLFEARFFFNF